MEFENKNNNILDDLDLRNRNWQKTDELKSDVVEIKRLLGQEQVEITSWQQVQNIVRSGNAKDYFEIGDQFTATFAGIEHKWDIIGIDHDIPSDTNYTHSLTIQAHDCLLNTQFSAPQALYKVKESALLPGDYSFTHDATDYQFTLTSEVPVEGHITFPWKYNTDILTTEVSTYASPASTTAIETVGIIAGSAGTKLTEINDINRCRYGSNNYIESGVRQWLNSDETTFKWKPQADYDRSSTYKTAGFLQLLDPDLVSVLGKVDKHVAQNTVTDGGGQGSFSDKVFLLSRKEVYGGDEGVTTGEKPYDYYSLMNDTSTTAAVDWRIKYLSSSPQYWWLRSPHVGHSNYVRSVHPSGIVSYNFAYSAHGASPACVII